MLSFSTDDDVFTEDQSNRRSTGALRRQGLEHGGFSMSVELMQFMIGFMFLAIWAITGQIIVRHPRRETTV